MCDCHDGIHFVVTFRGRVALVSKCKFSHSESSEFHVDNRKNSNMSQLESKDEHKIVPDGGGAYGRGRKHDNAHFGAIPKASKDSQASTSKMKTELTSTLDALYLTPTSSDEDENTNKREWLSARDSLEILPKSQDIISSKSMSCATTIHKCFNSDSPHSESLIGNPKNNSSSVSKVLAWDPWEKLSRKNKKENKRRKAEKSSEPNSATSSNKDKDTNRKDFKSGDEAAAALRLQSETQPAHEASYEEYAYQPYQKTTRAVEFTNKVMVVYINKEDKVVGEASEPLKKELEQQIRNKEMRRGHMPDVTFARRNVMSDWFKK